MTIAERSTWTAQARERLPASVAVPQRIPGRASRNPYSWAPGEQPDYTMSTEHPSDREAVSQSSSDTDHYIKCRRKKTKTAAVARAGCTGSVRTSGHEPLRVVMVSRNDRREGRRNHADQPAGEVFYRVEQVACS